MTGTTVRRWALSVVASAALAATAACTATTTAAGPSPQPTPAGGGTASRDAARAAALPALRAVERATVSAGSARVESATRLGTMMSMNAKGVLAWRGGLTGALTIEYTGGTMADTMRSLGSTTMPARYLDDAYYARMSDTFAAKAGGRHWIRYGYDDLGGAGGTGAYLGLQDQMRDTTPDQPVKLLLTASDAHRAGTDTVGGRSVTRYSGTVDAARLATAGSGLSGGQIAELRKLLTQAGVTTETVDIWVDADGLLVKKAERSRTAGGTTTQTAYYTDYGVRVSVERPPAGDTRDFEDLIGKQGLTDDDG
ncbi:hypothetical protein ACIQU5_15160 [Streptomyces sp. NPDC090306]|uniref:hypothetical protein n=1 Tax=Streptomyces sp. NPDC090306 TaxID=3365961 RepID=UPI00380EFC89